ncbi:CoA transferase [Halieaceae bacterium IMCC14734]|uniref:CoA transferase n=1 Tax=Candidatus Litorirhabdus singularis TaxID=2518993 RepID=A0ABT3TGC4_9GAMM|nr:CaiB/BaiF CoA-transferase family protein [Candidatus Litorirhabdus singularis]MCX2981333.1 CoA transferase [Candidatus Litorirhabdus singularis]
MSGPLSGVKILDLGTMIAGPMAATVLSDQGADVIKVETPGVGDVMRYLGASCEGVTGLYHNTNRGKRSLALDLKSAEGVALLKELAADADIVLQNFRPGVADRLGVGYADLCEVNPELIYMSVCGFGDRGPYRDKAAYDNVIQAFGGVAQSQANPESGVPTGYYQLFSDKLTALTGSQALTAALFARERGQGGQHIRLSMVDAVSSFLWCDVSGTDTFANPNAQDGISVAKGLKLLQFSDGYGTAAPVTDSQFMGYCRVFGVNDLDPKFATVMGRNQHGVELLEAMAVVEPRALAMTTDAAIAALDAEDVPCARAMHLGELPQHEQMIANNSFAEVTHPQAGIVIEPNNPPNFEGTPSPPLRTMAAIGEHTDEILATLGKTPEQIKQWREGGVVG